MGTPVSYTHLYQIVLNNTQEYIDAIENGETILRNNLTEWLNNVTISTGIPLYDANKCITANAYNFSYETEEDGQETIISGYIIVSKHTKDMLTQIVYEQSFDEGSYAANKTYYYFNNWSGKGWEIEEGETEFDIYSKDANGKYKNVSNGMEMPEEDFEY